MTDDRPADPTLAGPSSEPGRGDEGGPGAGPLFPGPGAGAPGGGTPERAWAAPEPQAAQPRWSPSPPPVAGWAPPGWGQPPAGWPGPPSPPPGPAGGGSRRRQPLLVLATVLGALLIAAAVGIPSALLARGSQPEASPPATAPPSPTRGPQATQALTLYRRMLSAAEQSNGYHYVAVSSGGGFQQTITGDAGQGDGTQEITETTSFGSEQFSLRLTTDGKVYFQGNTPALEDQLGVTAGAAPSWDGKWVLVAIGDGPYQQLEVGITVESQLQGNALAPTGTETVQSGGATLTRITGTDGQGDAAHFDISPSTLLPQSYASAGGGATVTCTFSSWGTAPTVSSPAGAVPWSSLPTTRPPGGYGSGGQPSASPGGPATPSPSSTPGGSV